MTNGQTQMAQKSMDGKEEWLTPKYIIDALGPFDLDPCAPIVRPWDTASKHYTIEDNGLIKPWHGKVWCNPPYGPKTIQWMKRLKAHGNGIALIFARTETRTFFETVWGHADAIFFFKGRLTFYNVDGTEGIWNGGAPSCLVAYGSENANQLYLQRSLPGHCLLLDRKPNPTLEHLSL